LGVAESFLAVVFTPHTSIMDIVRGAARSVNSVAVKCPRHGSVRCEPVLHAITTLPLLPSGWQRYDLHLNTAHGQTPRRCQLYLCRTYSYGQLIAASDKLVEQLSSSLPAARGADGPRIGVYAEPGAEYVAATWATWKAGGIAVPLAVTHPPHELQYVMQDAGICKVGCCHPLCS
jgi:acyl-CoA synthetase (AMP-forming)/AMP-acid ligase II